MRKKIPLVLCAAVLCVWGLGAFAAASTSGQDVPQSKVEKIDALMKVYHDQDKFNGSVLVAEGGKVIYKKGFGLADAEWNIPNGPDTKFRLGSITKQFTSVLILQLVEEGKISLDGKLSDYLPYYRQDTGRKVTIHHLLTHGSGIPNYTALPAFESEISRNSYGVEEFIKKFCSGDLEFEPGARFNYSNSGYFILGAVIEKAAGKPYEQVLEERVLRPLGMENSGYDHHQAVLSHRARGYTQSLAGFRNADYLDMSLPYAAGSLYSTVEDLYLWDQALYTDTLLPAKMKELLFKPHIKMEPYAYGYGWTVGKMTLPQSKREVPFTSHGGGINGFISLIQRLTGERHLIVLLNNTDTASLGDISLAVTQILYGEPYGLPKISIGRTLYKTIQDKGLEAAVGQYRELKKTRPADYDFRAPELNRLGYALLEAKKADDAIRIFQLNIESFPQDANGYDSLAEAYAAKGEKALAIKNYAKSLELNPDNANAVEQLNKLTKKE